MQHKTKKENGKVICQNCKWSWTREPQSDCPGVPRFDWGEWSPNLKTKTQLRQMKMKPGAEPRGAYFRTSKVGKAEQFMWLYDEAEAVPTRQPSK